MVTMDIAPVIALVLNILSKLILAGDVGVRREENGHADRRSR
jgi:hypothetical protein